jgi:hypothetical protein
MKFLALAHFVPVIVTHSAASLLPGDTTWRRVKTWEKIDELAAEVKNKGGKEAVAKFRLMSGHDCIAHRLHKIGIYQTSRSVLCNNPDDVKDSEHLLHCPALNHEAQQTKDLVNLRK